METIFKKAISLLKEAGIEYKDITTPFWSDEYNGVVVPTIGKVIPLFQPTEDKKTWRGAMKLAEELGQQLPTIEEWHEIRRHRNVINEILASKGGDTITATFFWASTERDQDYAIGIYFSSGSMYISHKISGYYCRPLDAFNGLNKEE